MGNNRLKSGLACTVIAWAAGGAVVGSSSVARAAYFDVYTRDAEAEFDVDGSGVSSTGDLGTTSVSATILAAGLPVDFVAAGVTSVTLDVSATGGNVSADQGNMVEARGLGVASTGDTTVSDLNTDESLTYTISSLGFAGVEIIGVRFGGFRNAFPVSEAVLTGATVGGATTLTGGTSVVPSDGMVFFDSGVTSFTVSGTTDNVNAAFRITGVELAVPEPASAALVMLGAAGLLRRRR